MDTADKCDYMESSQGEDETPGRETEDGGDTAMEDGGDTAMEDGGDTAMEETETAMEETETETEPEAETERDEFHDALPPGDMSDLTLSSDGLDDEDEDGDADVSMDTEDEDYVDNLDGNCNIEIFDLDSEWEHNDTVSQGMSQKFSLQWNLCENWYSSFHSVLVVSIL